MFVNNMVWKAVHGSLLTNQAEEKSVYLCEHSLDIDVSYDLRPKSIFTNNKLNKYSNRPLKLHFFFYEQKGQNAQKKIKLKIPLRG